MEQNLELFAPPMLNEYCLLEIFKYLNLDDSISFGDCCRYLRTVADRVFKRYSRFQLKLKCSEKDERYINKVISHIGSHISTLEVYCIHVDQDLRKILKMVGNNCSNLKNFKLIDQIPIKKIGSQADESTYNFETVESLILDQYDSRSTKGFLQSFRCLKTLRLSRCFINAEETKSLIHNNPNIETLCSENLRGTLQLLHRLPPLLTLKCLTKLRLDCNAKKINRFLSELAKRGIIEELKLIDVDVDEQFFNILTLFGKIRLLEIGYDNKTRHQLLPVSYRGYKKLKSSVIWPGTLQSLRLICFEFTLDGLIEIVRQLGSLELLQLDASVIASSDSISFEDEIIFSEVTLPCILQAVYNGTGEQCRLVALPWSISMICLVQHADRGKFVDCEWNSEYSSVTNVTRYPMY